MTPAAHPSDRRLPGSPLATWLAGGALAINLGLGGLAVAAFAGKFRQWEGVLLAAAPVLIPALFLMLAAYLSRQSALAASIALTASLLTAALWGGLYGVALMDQQLGRLGQNRSGWDPGSFATLHLLLWTIALVWGAAVVGLVLCGIVGAVAARNHQRGAAGSDAGSAAGSRETYG